MPARPVHGAVAVDQGTKASQPLVTQLTARDPSPSGPRPDSTRASIGTGGGSSVQATLGPVARQVKSPELL
eukprot:15470344-Alexandrium_andersonii.AAC.1